MQVKRFVAPTMSEALKQLRASVGADAVILSNKRVAEGVELVAAIEDSKPDPEDVFPADLREQLLGRKPELKKTTSKLEQELDRMQADSKKRAVELAATLGHKQQRQFATAMAEQQAEMAADTHQDTLVAEPEIDQQEAIRQAVQKAVTELENKKTSENVSELRAVSETKQMDAMRQELNAMRDMLEHQLSTMAWGQYVEKDPERAQLWRRLKKMGIQAYVANQLLSEYRDGGEYSHAWVAMMQQLGANIPTVNNDLLETGGIFSFVGPTGAGKTTSIAKLAAQYVMAHGSEGIALVTTDTYRIAAHEQLRSIGRILDVPVKIVDKAHALDRVLYSLRHKKLILIDTAGLNKSDQRLLRQTQSLNELGDTIKTILVLPTTSQPQVLQAAYQLYKTDNLAACVLTKLDETASLGEALSISIEQQLPIAYSTDGQCIPDDISKADALALVRKTIELAKSHKVDDDAMSADLHSLIG